MLPNITYILRTYGYFVVGTMLILINIPAFLLVIIRKALRKTYVVIAVVFLNNGFTGISVILLGMKRLIYSADEKLISHHECVLSIPVLLLTVLCLDGLSLLTNSLERFCVVAFPIYYYAHSTRISYSLITAQYVITITVVTAAVIASLIEPIRLISKFCVKFGAQFLSSHSHNRDLSHFLKNQKRYTQTALISCCFTFFLVVVPSTVECIYVMDSSITSQIIVMCCVYLRLLNSFNLVVLFLYRQRDFRYAAIQCFKHLFSERKQHVQPAVIVGFGE
ncbi:putative integral membrane protein [Brugia pahangi]